MLCVCIGGCRCSCFVCECFVMKMLIVCVHPVEVLNAD